MRIRTGLSRTTTQMLNHSRSKTKISSSRRSSLLSALRNKNSGLMNTRFGMMNASSIQSARLQRSKYEKLENASASLLEQTKLLAEKAETGGKDLSGTAADMVQNFNDTLEYLGQSSGILNNYYRQTMKEIVATNRDALEEAGISVRKDGTLSLNKEKFAGADPEKIRKAIGATSDFAKRMQAVASRTADNAKASAQSAASQYNANGAMTNSYLSRYNFRG